MGKPSCQMYDDASKDKKNHRYLRNDLSWFGTGYDRIFETLIKIYL